MAKSKSSKHLERSSMNGGYVFSQGPDLTMFALQEEQMIGTIEKRFKDQAVRQLDCDFYIGHHSDSRRASLSGERALQMPS
jgi:hypothetical protein